MAADARRPGRPKYPSNVPRTETGDLALFITGNVNYFDISLFTKVTHIKMLDGSPPEPNRLRRCRAVHSVPVDLPLTFRLMHSDASRSSIAGDLTGRKWAAIGQMSPFVRVLFPQRNFECPTHIFSLISHYYNNNIINFPFSRLCLSPMQYK